jgi:hypothetical protein
MSTRTSLSALLAFALLVLAATFASAVSSAYASEAFGIERYALAATEENGSADTQAGSHPYELSTEVAFDGTGGTLDDLSFELPPGVVLDPGTVAPFFQCSIVEFVKGACANGAAVGVAMVSAGGKVYPAAVYDLAPQTGSLGQLGFIVDDAVFFIDVAVRPGAGGMTLSIDQVPQFLAPIAIGLTLWGNPGDPGHNASRGRCATREETDCAGGASPAAFVTLPTACAGALDTASTVRANTWQDEAEWVSGAASLSQMTGCNRLGFDPALNVVPDTNAADEPSGYRVLLSMPQTESPEGLATAPPENASVTFPAGSSLSLLSLSDATGCGEAQAGLDSDEPSMCPNASKIGTVKIGTLLLAHPLESAMFLAIPNANPLGALVAVYVLAEEPVSGVRIKLAGQIDLNPVTGQPTLTFDDLPQLPLGEIDLEPFGGERTLLVNPSSCGQATSIGHLAPWSGSGEAEVSSSFAVSWGGPGGECPDPLPFEPSLNAGMLNASAGSYSPFILAVSSGDRQQLLSGLRVQLPPGLQWMLGSVPACGEPAAAAGTCPQDSQIGTAIIRGGPAGTPASFTGSVYLTEGYGGAPYGLSIAFSAQAGPFDLGTLVLRAALAQNQSTGALSITSGPLPQLIDGVGLQTRALELDIDRPEFVLNPTVCESRQIAATIEGAQGTSVQASDPFAVEGCENPADDGDATEEAAGAAGSTGAGDRGGAAPGAGGVSLVGTRVVAKKDGQAAVELRCAGPETCRGRLTLTVRTKNAARTSGEQHGARRGDPGTTTIAMAPFAISAGKTTAVEVGLNAAGRALLDANHGRLSATLTIFKSDPAPSQRQTETIHLTDQRAAKARKTTK